MVQNMEQDIRISQCMIVKNEENNIRRALSWGKEIMWEQIVVDTGSTDRTAEIAEEMGAKLYRFPWIDDFAAAKNFAIRQAKGDWIVFLDADEYFLPEDVEKLVSILRELGADGKKNPQNAVIASWVQTDGSEEISREGTGGKLKWNLAQKADGSTGMFLSGTQIRVFRNQPGLYYRGRIHEKLFMDQGQLLCRDASEELFILHTGYIPSEMEEKKKVERNIALVKKELEDHPDDYQLLSYLGDSYFQQQDPEEAALWYEKAAAHIPGNLPETSIQGAMVFKHLLVIYGNLSDEKAALNAYRTGRKRFPKEADYDYLLGQNYVHARQYEKGAHHLQRALELLDRYGSDGRSTLLAHNLIGAWELLVMCNYENGKLEQCVNAAVTILRADPWRPETLKYMLLAFKKDEEQAQAERKEQPKKGRPAGKPRQAATPAQVLAFLGNIYNLEPKENRSFVRDAARAAGYEGLIREMGPVMVW